MRRVNITIEFEGDEEAHAFEQWLSQYVKIFDFTLLTDTKELYENDTHFRELTKKYKQAKQLRNDYINKHNFKQKKL